jgi:glycerophosphoryl diester phosphodiesterase
MDSLFHSGALCSLPDRPLVIAHRGASRYATENSLEAFEIAIVQGADMIEFDVRRTADDVLVAYHDETVHGLPLCEMSYDAVRRVLPHLATLDDLLATMAGRVRMDVELKEEGYEDIVLEKLQTRVPLEDVLVTSFSPRVVARVKEIEPSVRTGWIVKGAQSPGLFARYARTGADWLIAETDSLSPELVAEVGAHDVPLAVFTVNLWSEIDATLSVPGLSAVITDLPDVARALRDRHANERVEWVAS